MKYPLIPVLFALILSAPGPARAVEVQLSSGRTLETGLAEARLVAELGAFAVIAGRSCIACDENTSIYLHRISPRDKRVSAGRESPATPERYTYPGDYRDYLSEELVEKTRLFYGQCYEGQAALLWLSEYRVEGDWQKDEFLIVFRDGGMEERYNEGRQPGRLHTGHADCRELPGIDAETEP
ncbi:hypothetical protein [Microbulbifer yueqingensis]|uniref:hypothetical protein n=1 Tax=Microbulbifer yueqingensis TaxID=658219 RepID=UPI001113F714|nr:hypothetical protein [Microbulbifer yueqingensis]